MHDHITFQIYVVVYCVYLFIALHRQCRLNSIVVSVASEAKNILRPHVPHVPRAIWILFGVFFKF